MSGAGKGVWRRFVPDFDNATPADGETWVWDASESEWVPSSGQAIGGRWEVIVDGTAPPVAVTNEDEDDWIYGWVSD